MSGSSTWVQHSAEKLENVSENLKELGIKCSTRPCLSLEDTMQYRCRCSFQFVRAEEDGLQYAIRQANQAFVIHSSPLVSIRIQKCMKTLLDLLNRGRFDHVASGSLASVALAASWSNHMDCFVTLNYDQPIESEHGWLEQARFICLASNMTQLTGRSRGRSLRALPDAPDVVKDRLWISKLDWNVTLKEPLCDSGSEWILVNYCKPQDAFSHPNRNAMCTALQWILRRVASVVESRDSESYSLLELYCGCGAHTMPLAKCGLLRRIVAIELDQRLIKACMHNCKDNDVKNVEVVAQDAGVWARQTVAPFDILLVDPPKSGLDEAVCSMANEGSFTDLLYISCGKEALIRDLQRLESSFRVVDCTLLDLFPRTHAVESLVHLRRLRDDQECSL